MLKIIPQRWLVMAKYAPLENYLETNGKTHVPMTFADIESIIATLPTAPPKSSPHLPNSGSATHALIGAMRETVTVSAGVDLTQPTGVKWEAEIT